ETELEKIRNSIDRNKQDFEEINNLLKEINLKFKEKKEMLLENEKKEEELNSRFNKMFSERDSTQKQIQESSIKLTEIQSEIRQIEDQINYLKIGKAKLDGERETLDMDFVEMSDIALIQGSLASLEEKLERTQEILRSIGSINMRALEVYEEIKKEYDIVKEKVETIEKEKIEILKVIEEIDKKKRAVFMRTYKALNEHFSSNFSRLSAKGTAYLEIENKEDVFAGGIEIIVKFAKGKYFDVASLSGGEQTLVALSLLFAIQQFKPYKFYILDEIDAALDKRNSERLAALLNQYMRSGQYIVITHNDAIILDSQVLYGVSMHDGVSKILSLKISDDVRKVKEESENQVEEEPQDQSGY
ncbi:MAG: AAA family ATPase, partial [Nanoarchaeota archaeon]